MPVYTPKIRQFIAFFCSILTLPGIITSQILSTRTYTIKEGLPANDVEAISQDSYGRLWIGTPNGVSVFDGKTFTNYSVKDGLPNNFVSKIIPDRIVPGKMWLQSGRSLSSFNGRKFTTHSLEGRNVRAIYQDAHGVVWCGTNCGIKLIGNDSVSSFSLPILEQNINAIESAGDILMWFALDSILVSVSLETREIRKVNFRKLGDGNFFGMKADQSGNLWVIMGSSVLARVAPNGVIQIRRQSQGPSFIDFSINDSIAWVGGLPGVGTFNMNKFPNVVINEYSLETETRNANDIREGFIDREGNVWIGHLIHGISRLNKPNRIVFPLGKLWDTYHHQFAASDSNGHIWVLTDGDLLEFWKDRERTWHSYRHPFSEGDPYNPNEYYGAHETAAAFTFDHAGRLWVAQALENRVMICFEIQLETSGADSGRSRLTLAATVPMEEAVKSFVVDKNNRLWANFWNQKGLAVIDVQHGNKLVRTFTESDSFPVNYVREMFEDSRGNIWGSTFRDGVVRIAESDLERGQFRRFSVRDGLPEMSTFPIIEDHSGNILVGTNNGGMAIFHGDSIETFSVMNGLPSNNTSCMAIDWLGRIWLGTPTGMVHETTPHSWIFSSDQSFYEVQPSGCGVTQDGLLWWASLGGLSVYDYLREPTFSIAPPIQIKDIKVNGERVFPGESLVLDYDQNNLEIDFIGISLKDPEIRYRYRLVGSEERWSPPTSNASITFGSLSPGGYAFQVMAINVDGVHSSAPATLMFSIRPPYWREWWFFALAALTGFSMLYFGYRRRVQNLVHERQISQKFSRKLIESQEQERKRVARELHDNLGQELIIIANRARKGLKVASEHQARDQFDLISKGASGALESVREIAYNLSPYHLDQVGLTGSIRGMVNNLGSLSDIRFELKFNDEELMFPKEFEIHLYRITQECVNNIVKHSGATEATIDIGRIDGMLRIEVSDNGKGFPPDSMSTRTGIQQGFGLRGLDERVKLLNGVMMIDSSKGNGTRIRIVIPMNQIRSDDSLHSGGKEKLL